MEATTNPLLLQSAELSEISSNVIKDFIATGLDENYTVEVKTYSKADSEGGYKIRKAISSLANQQGGFLIVGIKDKKNSKNPNSIEERVIGHGVTGEAQKWIDDICSKGFMTPQVSYRSALVIVEGVEVLVIQVIRSVIGPISVKKNAGSMIEFWVRGNGSDVPMDYMDLSKRYQSNKTSVISAIFIDLLDTYRDLHKIKEKPPALNTFTPIRIVSAAIEDRMELYSITDYDKYLVSHINNLRRVLPVINAVFELGNNAHMESKTISNSSELVDSLRMWAGRAADQVLYITKDLQRLFPEIGERFIDLFDMGDGPKSS